jgi:hypothetical protein
MEIFTLEQLNTFYRWSRILLAIFGVITALITIVSFYLSDRISSLQEKEKAQAQARLEVAEKQIVDTRQKAESAEITANQLKEKARHRHLNPEQVSSISTHLKNSVKYTIELQCITNNTEAWQFAEQIKVVFESAGYSFARIVPIINIPPIKGIRIRAKIQPQKGMDKAIAELLQSQGQPLTIEKTEQQTADITIQIGEKK